MAVRGYLVYVAGFGVARGALFLSPIILANLLSIESYGAIELAHSLASLGAVVIGVGLPATVPLILLREEVHQRWDTMLLLVLALSALLLTMGLTLAASIGPFNVAALVSLATSVLILQGVWATTLKSNGKSTSAVFLEAGFWSVCVIGGAAVFFASSPDQAVIWAVVAYGVGLLAFTTTRYTAVRARFSLADCIDNLVLGAPLMLASVLTILVSSTGRLVLGLVVGAEAVGAYGIVFRVSALPLVGHQILIIGFFRFMFSWDHRVLTRRSPLIVWGVTSAALVFMLAVDVIKPLLGTAFNEAFRIYRLEGFIILAQTVLWSAIAVNDLLNSRLQIAGQVARNCIIFLLPALIAIAFVTHLQSGSGLAASLRVFVVCHSLLMLAYYATQCHAMFLRGTVYVRLWGSAVGGFAIVLAGALLDHMLR